MRGRERDTEIERGRVWEGRGTEGKRERKAERLREVDTEWERGREGERR